MFDIQGKLISLELVESKFVCDLNACKGACCTAGDLGAPLDEDEAHILVADYAQIAPFLIDEGRAVIDAEGQFTTDAKGELATPLVNGGPCAYLTYDELGISRCGIEQAWRAGATSFRKPISCHLYPIRINENKRLGFEALNYDRWDICSAACKLGKKLKVPVYKFLEEALVRKYGAAFFAELDEVATAWNKK